MLCDAVVCPARVALAGSSAPAARCDGERCPSACSVTPSSAGEDGIADNIPSDCQLGLTSSSCP
eukprot:9504907-Lingulodinium_polyedra.AAC.1